MKEIKGFEYFGCDSMTQHYKYTYKRYLSNWIIEAGQNQANGGQKLNCQYVLLGSIDQSTSHTSPSFITKEHMQSDAKVAIIYMQR